LLQTLYSRGRWVPADEGGSRCNCRCADGMRGGVGSRITGTCWPAYCKRGRTSWRPAHSRSGHPSPRRSFQGIGNNLLHSWNFSWPVAVAAGLVSSPYNRHHDREGSAVRSSRLPKADLVVDRRRYVPTYSAANTHSRRKSDRGSRMMIILSSIVAAAISNSRVSTVRRARCRHP